MLDEDLFRPIDGAPDQLAAHLLHFWTITALQPFPNTRTYSLTKWGVTAAGEAEPLETLAVASRIEDIRALIPDGKANIRGILQEFENAEIKEVWL